MMRSENTDAEDGKFVLVDLRRSDHEVSRQRFASRCCPKSRSFSLTKLQGGTIRGSLNLPAQSLYPAIPTIYTIFKAARISKVIWYCGECWGQLQTMTRPLWVFFLISQPNQLHRVVVAPALPAGLTTTSPTNATARCRAWSYWTVSRDGPLRAASMCSGWMNMTHCIGPLSENGGTLDSLEGNSRTSMRPSWPGPIAIRTLLCT